MRTFLIIEADQTQLVLSPESQHDIAVLTVLQQLPTAHRIEFYRTRGGWTNASLMQNYGSGSQENARDLAIVFSTTITRDNA